MRHRRKGVDDPRPSHPDPLYGVSGIEPDWTPIKSGRGGTPPANEIPTFEVVLPPHVVEGSGTGHQGAHWLMGANRILDIASAYETLFVLQQVWMTADYADEGDGWFMINLHNSPHDVGNTGSGGIGWGFGNGVSCIAWNAQSGGKFCQHVEQVNDSANGSAATDYPLVDWPVGKWITLLAEIRFGRGDGTTKHTGYVKTWVDGVECLNIDPITNVQRAKNPANGQTYTQTLTEVWNGGPYRIDVNASDPDVSYVARMTLAQIGATLEACYADRPVPDQEWGVATPCPGWTGPTTPSYSTQLTGTDARTVDDLVLPQWAMDELGIDGGVTPPDPTPPPDDDVQAQLDALDARATALESKMDGIGQAASS